MTKKLALACALGAIAAALIAAAAVIAGFAALPDMIASQNYSGIVAAFAGAFAVSIALAVIMVIVSFCCGVFFLFSVLLAVLFFRIRAGKPLTKGRFVFLCVSLIGDIAAIIGAIFLCALPAYPATLATGILLFVCVAINLTLRILCTVCLKRNHQDDQPISSDSSEHDMPLQ